LKIGHEYGAYKTQIAQDKVEYNRYDYGEYKYGQNVSALYFQRTVFGGNQEIGYGACKWYKKRV
jgi:hypothetical protein|tara:strand:+ start:42 stop:233 length:192 start_codon:yes stop_codon:yes gene_type:complete